ncbi:MAG: DUF1573 domain-containing protein [Planctomycetota bacterium]|jgi:hypothetical protein
MALPPDRPPPTLGRQLRAAGGLLLVALVLVGAAYGVWWYLAGRPVLTGDDAVDFGTAQLVAEPVTFKHTFLLTNRKRRSIEIRDIKTTCGCAVAEPSTTTLEPGASVEIASTLTLKREGLKDARIFLIYGDGTERDVLHLRGAARLKQRLSVVPGPAALAPGAVVERVLFYLDYDSNDSPPAPRITAPAEVRAEFTQWTQMTRRRRAQGLPARWRGEVRLERADEASPDHATVVVEVGADQKAQIPLKFE